MKRVVILQPSYLPWLGFFEQMYVCDIFVYLNDVQYTKNDWRNRNRIKTREGMQWLTVPVSFQFGQKINEVPINNSYPWYKKHFQALKTWYGKSEYFNIYSEELKEILYKERTYLEELDIELTQWMIKKLGLNPKTVLSSDLSVSPGDRQFRLIEICKALGCDYFYEGKSGQNYIDIKLFKSHGIMVEFQNYHHPYYNQLWLKEQGFVSHLSAIDLLFNHGPDSLSILTGRKVISKPEK
jgi:hypothetical protein